MVLEILGGAVAGFIAGLASHKAVVAEDIRLATAVKKLLGEKMTASVAVKTSEIVGVAAAPVVPEKK